MRFKKYVALLLIVVTIFAAIPGCGEKKNWDNYLQVVEESMLKSLDAAMVSDLLSIEIIGNCIEGLLTYDENDNIAPGIAESYDVSEDGKTYTFHIRDSVWNNGEAVTAHDFVYAWRRLASVGSGYAFLLSDVMGIKNGKSIIDGDGNGNYADVSTLGVYADNDKTLRIELEVPVSFLPSVVAFPILGPLKQDFYESLEEGYYGTSTETFLSNGAFEIESYMPGTTNIILKKNEKYYNASAVMLDGINYHVVSSDSTGIEIFKAKSADKVAIKGSSIPMVRADENLFRYLTFEKSGLMQYLTFHIEEGGTDDVNNQNLRLAISKAIDKEYICNTGLKNGSTTANTPVPVGFAYSMTTGKDFAEDQSVYKDYYGYDVDKAKQYFELAKKELGKDEIKISINISGATGDAATSAQIIKHQLEKNLPGLKVTLISQTSAELKANCRAHNFQISYTSWGPDYADPMTYLTMWMSGNSFNYGDWKNEEFDRLIEESLTGKYVNDYEKRWEAMKQAESLVAKEVAIIPVYRFSGAYLLSDKFEGIVFQGLGFTDYKYMKRK